MENPNYSASAEDIYRTAVGVAKYMYESNMTREGIEGILRMYALIMEEIPSYNGVFWQKLKKWDEVRKKLNDPGLADRLIAEFEEEKAKKVKIN